MHALTSALAISAALIATPASAMESPASAMESDEPPATEPTETAAPDTGDSAARTYTPADLARFAPSNALDMLNRVPGFQIRSSDQDRGLGQASGNVLFNGARPSSKSESIFAQLIRIPIGNITRVEIVDGATLDIPGLSGQVANVVFEANGLTGQFRWSPQFRTNFTDPAFTRGSISISGRSGELAYEIGLNNNDSGRGGAGGETLIRNADGDVIEQRDDVIVSFYDTPRLSANLTWDPAGDLVAHLNGSYQRVYDRFHEDGLRTGGGLPDRERLVRFRGDGWNYEIGGDVEFGFGPGRLKLIGLQRSANEPFQTTITNDYFDLTPDDGVRFSRDGDTNETIARAEYSFPLFGGDAQIASEAAFNTLDNVAGLFELDPASGEFVEVPFPGGTGSVSEDRYEVIGSYGRSLTDTLSFQLTGGAEKSTITTTGATMQTRTFTRPKGSFALQWNPYDDLSISTKISRTVGQLSFFDFLARANLNDGTDNASNNDLRPRQNWVYEGEVSKQLGEWGSTKLRFVFRDAEDFVDIVPVEGGEAIGNIDQAWARTFSWNSTITFDPIGLTGVRGDFSVLLQESRLIDPFTGQPRQWSGMRDTGIFIDLRHDIPNSDWAYGINGNYTHGQPDYRSDQVQLDREGPVFADVFVEHKDVFGLRVTAYIANIFDARQIRERTVYTGIRGESPVKFTEHRDRLIGPIFGLNVNGSF